MGMWESSPVFHFAYVFERFPTFTQTFCVREVLELERQGLRPLIFSVRDTRDEVLRDFPEELVERVHVLPPEKELVEFIKIEKEANRLPQETVLTLRQWGERPDKMRVYEAAYIGQKMLAAGVRHAHAHFAGVGARVCWWLRWCYDFTFSFTGHANDVFCDDNESPITLQRLMNDASLVVTVSDFTAGDLHHRFPAAARNVRRVYNGLDLARFEVRHAPTHPPLIFSVGRLIEKKGFDDLITACARLKERGLSFRCEIAGDGPLETELREQIDRLGVGDRVTLLGATTQGEIIGKLGETRVFALACVTERDGGRDNLPTVLMEAMAAKIPCVSTRLAGVPEMVEDGVSGLLVEERHPDELAAALEKVLVDDELAQRFGEAGHARAQRLFAQEVTASQLLRLFAAHGLVNFDAALVARHPALWPAYARQVAWRAARTLRFKGLRHRRAPAFLD
jgi:colanic acid/amylovoran biosynthesis glycosyltransferase